MQQCRSTLGRLVHRSSRSPDAIKRGLSSETPPGVPQQPGFDPEEPPPPPPNVFATVGAMGAGAVGAVFIAAVGVWGVFKMAFYVASETGRSMNAKSPAAGGGSSPTSASADQQTAATPDVKAASPLEAHQLGTLETSLAAAGSWMGAAVSHCRSWVDWRRA